MVGTSIITFYGAPGCLRTHSQSMILSVTIAWCIIANWYFSSRCLDLPLGIMDPVDPRCFWVAALRPNAQGSGTLHPPFLANI